MYGDISIVCFHLTKSYFSEGRKVLPNQSSVKYLFLTNHVVAKTVFFTKSCYGENSIDTELQLGKKNFVPSFVGTISFVEITTNCQEYCPTRGHEGLMEG